MDPCQTSQVTSGKVHVPLTPERELGPRGSWPSRMQFMPRAQRHVPHTSFPRSSAGATPLLPQRRASIQVSSLHTNTLHRDTLLMQGNNQNLVIGCCMCSGRPVDILLQPVNIQIT